MSSLGRPVSIYPSLNKTTIFHSCPLPSVRFTDLPLYRAKLTSSSSMEAPPSEYRKNVGICLINPSNNKVFTASRLDIPGAWQMPQGGVDEGEDPRYAAIRELREETGVKSAEILAEAPYWLTYDFPPEVRVKLNNRWGTKWKGQAQKWRDYYDYKGYTGALSRVDEAYSGLKRHLNGPTVEVNPPPESIKNKENSLGDAPKALLEIYEPIHALKEETCMHRGGHSGLLKERGGRVR